MAKKPVAKGKGTKARTRRSSDDRSAENSRAMMKQRLLSLTGLVSTLESRIFHLEMCIEPAHAGSDAEEE